jgi:hypothetical protein
MAHLLVIVLFLSVTTSCGGPDLPFQYNYTSSDTVDIILNGTSYQIGKNLPPANNLPFQYNFESDGDLNITVAGKSYEIESPYDYDGKVKKKKKSAPKRSTAPKAAPKAAPAKKVNR